jgi:cyclopropane fatty-acyl-phospholipid synthase-like methyltransferase
MTPDKSTIAFYDTQAEVYAKWSEPFERPKYLDNLIAHLPAGGSVLDLGCGGGWASRVMAGQGLMVTAMDASAGLLRQIQSLDGITLRHAGFDQLNDVAAFDGVWASYSLQHAPRDRMPSILHSISTALRPHGHLYIGVQKGPETRRDSIGRFYCHYQEDELRELLIDAGFGGISMEVGAGKNYDGTPTENLNVEAHKIA